MSAIGIFDSGVGGLTVVRAVRRVLPTEDIVYLGDTARVPYGSKSPETVIRYSLACARFLIARGVKLLLIACNTASAHAMKALAELEVPVIGAVEPGARTAHQASRTGRIGVIGTLGTIRSGAYASALRSLDERAIVSGQACPLLVPLAEEGWTAGEIADQICGRYLGELAKQDAKIDTLVLGCTHYPLLADVLAGAAKRTFAEPVQLVDSATAMAQAARDSLVPNGGTGKLHVSVTDDSRLEELAPRFLGEPITSFERVDL
jgi:glutamate racemase